MRMILQMNIGIWSWCLVSSLMLNGCGFWAISLPDGDIRTHWQRHTITKGVPRHILPTGNSETRKYFFGTEEAAVVPPHDFRLIWYKHGHRSDLRALKFSPSGDSIYSCSQDWTFRKWDAVTGDHEKTWDMRVATNCIDIDPMSKYLIVGTCHFTAHLFDLDDAGPEDWDQGSETYFWPSGRPGACISDAKFSPDMRIAITADVDGKLMAWDLQTGCGLQEFIGHVGQVTAFDFTPDGEHVVSVGLDGNLRVWRVDTGECLKVLKGQSSSLWDVAVSPDGKYAISGGNLGCDIWNMDTGICLRNLDQSLPVVDVDVSRDGRFLLTAGMGQGMKLWDIDSGRSLYVFHTPEKVFNVAFSPDGRNAVSDGILEGFALWNLVGIEGYYADRDYGILEQVSSIYHLIDMGHYPQAASVFSEMAPSELPLRDNIKLKFLFESIDVFVDARERIEAYLDEDSFGKAFKVYTQALPCLHFELSRQLQRLVDDGRCVLTYGETETPVYSMDISADGKIVAMGYKDGQVRLWDISSGKCIDVFQVDDNPIYGLKYCPGSDKMIIVTNKMYCWDITQRKAVWKAGNVMGFGKSHRGGTALDQVTSDGQWLFTHGNQEIKLWDVQTGNCLRTFNGHRWYVNSAAVDPTGHYLLSSSYDDTIKLWDASTGECLQTLSFFSTPVAVHWIDCSSALVCVYNKIYRIQLKDGSMEIVNTYYNSMAGSELGYVLSSGKPFVVESDEHGRFLLLDMNSREYTWNMSRGFYVGWQGGILTMDGHYLIAGGSPPCLLDLWGLTYDIDE